MRKNSPDPLLMSSADRRRVRAEKYAVNEGTIANLCISLNKLLRVNHVMCQNAEQVTQSAFSFPRFSSDYSLFTRMR